MSSTLEVPESLLHLSPDALVVHGQLVALTRLFLLEMATTRPESIRALLQALEDPGQIADVDAGDAETQIEAIQKGFSDHNDTLRVILERFAKVRAAQEPTP